MALGEVYGHFDAMRMGASDTRVSATNALDIGAQQTYQVHAAQPYISGLDGQAAADTNNRYANLNLNNEAERLQLEAAHLDRGADDMQNTLQQNIADLTF